MEGKSKAIVLLFIFAGSLMFFSFLSSFISENVKIQLAFIFFGVLISIFIGLIFINRDSEEDNDLPPEDIKEYIQNAKPILKRYGYYIVDKDDKKEMNDEVLPFLKKQGYVYENNFWKIFGISVIVVFLLLGIVFGWLIYSGKLDGLIQNSVNPEMYSNINNSYSFNLSESNSFENHNLNNFTINNYNNIIIPNDICP